MMTLARDIETSEPSIDESAIDDAKTLSEIHEIITQIHVNIGTIEAQLKYGGDQPMSWRNRATAAVGFNRAMLTKAHNRLKALKGTAEAYEANVEAARMRKELKRQNDLKAQELKLEEKRIQNERRASEQADARERSRLKHEQQQRVNIESVIISLRRGRFERYFVAEARASLSAEVYDALSTAAEAALGDGLIDTLKRAGFDPGILAESGSQPIDGAGFRK